MTLQERITEARAQGWAVGEPTASRGGSQLAYSQGHVAVYVYDDGRFTVSIGEGILGGSQVLPIPRREDVLAIAEKIRRAEQDVQRELVALVRGTAATKEAKALRGEEV